MVKIDRTEYSNRIDVQKLIKANPIWDRDNQPCFDWKFKIGNRTFNVRKKILPVLLEMTNHHCSFCDLYPLSKELHPVHIEHFHPKSKFPEKAYSWENLFPACNPCNLSKGKQFDEDLLRPDEPSYSFESYFRIDGEGKILPSYYADLVEEKKAKTTIDIYKLNRGWLITLRQQCLIDYIKLAPINDVEDRSFRFLISIVNGMPSIDNIINRFIHD